MKVSFEQKEKPTLSDNDDDGEYADEPVFNKESEILFITSNNIEVLGVDPSTDNNLHKEIIITPKDKRIMSDIMTSFEYTRVISERSKQIENNSPIFCDRGDETDIGKIAEMEILQKKCPINITRHLYKNIVEIWDVNEMVPPFNM